jgi:hypothetical protein
MQKQQQQQQQQILWITIVIHSVNGCGEIIFFSHLLDLVIIIIKLNKKN